MAFFSTLQFSDDDDEGDARPRVYYEDDANEHVEGEEPDYSTSQGDDPWRASAPIWRTIEYSTIDAEHHVVRRVMIS